MPAQSPFEILAAELGAVAGRIEREASLRISAALAEIGRIDAERELRLANLERQATERIAEVRDGRDGADGEPGRDGIDGAPGRDGAEGPPGRDADMAFIVEQIDEAAARRTAEQVTRAIAELPPPLSGADGKDGQGIDDIDVVQHDGRTLVLSFTRGDLTESFEFELPEGPQGKPGERGEAGKHGAPGKLGKAEEWREGVHYEGDVRTHAGATWQALRDTAAAPPHDDWQLLAAAGRNGADGRGFAIRGTWSEAEDYQALDVVALNGGSFVARRDNPGACPGDGWQLIAGQGKRGDRGERGLRGERGELGPPVVAMDISGEGLLTLTNGDGSVVTCDLYPLLASISR